jgi:hypothetical protein
MGGRAVERRSARYICRTPAVQPVVGPPIKVRNTREMVLWWDAQTPDRIPSLGSRTA